MARLLGLPLDGIDATRYMERYCNDLPRSEAGFDHKYWSDTDPVYSPLFGKPIFAAPTLRIPREDASIYTADPDTLLVDQLLPHDVIFTVHPEIFGGDFKNRFKSSSSANPQWRPFMVTPTSSTRTLLTYGECSDFFIKTDLDKRHYGFIRSLKRSGVKHSIRMSEEVVRIATNHSEYGLAVLPETIGIVIGGLSDELSSGVIYREKRPRPIIPVDRTLVPFFSLYANDLKAPNDPPLLIQLLQYNSSKGKELDYFLQEIIQRLLYPWATFVIAHGILLEMHGQNTLLEIDADFQPGRIIVRDFQGMYLDPETREKNGLAIFSELCLVGNESGITRRQHYSHLFDHLIGKLLLERLTKTFVRYFSEHTYSQVAKQIRLLVSNLIDTSQWMSYKAFRFDKVRKENRSIWTMRTENDPIFRY